MRRTRSLGLAVGIWAIAAGLAPEAARAVPVTFTMTGTTIMESTRDSNDTAELSLLTLIGDFSTTINATNGQIAGYELSITSGQMTLDGESFILLPDDDVAGYGVTFNAAGIELGTSGVLNALAGNSTRYEINSDESLLTFGAGGEVVWTIPAKSSLNILDVLTRGLPSGEITYVNSTNLVLASSQVPEPATLLLAAAGAASLALARAGRRGRRR